MAKSINYKEKSLPDLLKHARTWAYLDHGSLNEVMYRISGNDNWNREQCRAFFRSIIIKFAKDEETRDFLLYVTSLHPRTARIPKADNRRDAYFVDKEYKITDQKIIAANKKTYTSRENATLTDIGRLLQEGIDADIYMLDPESGELKEKKNSHKTDIIDQLDQASSATILADSGLSSPTMFWGLLPENEYFTGRTNELAKIEDKFSQGIIIQILHGLPGIGKTLVALQYAYRHISDYSLIVYLDASDENTLLSGCAAFLRSVGIDTSHLNRRDVNYEFQKYMGSVTNWLLIYDGFNPLPSNALTLIEDNIPRNVKSGNIIITSRSLTRYIGASVLSIDVLDEDSSVEYIINRSGNDDGIGAKELAKSLGYYPLAMELASAYIEETSNSSIDSYLDLLKKRGLSILEIPVKPNNYEYSVKQVFFQVLKGVSEGQDSDYSELVNTYLYCCSVLGGYNIDPQLLEQAAQFKKASCLSNESREGKINKGSLSTIQECACYDIPKVTDRIRYILNRYSLIKISNSDGMVSINPFVQKLVLEYISKCDPQMDDYLLLSLIGSYCDRMSRWTLANSLHMKKHRAFLDIVKHSIDSLLDHKEKQRRPHETVKGIFRHRDVFIKTGISCFDKICHADYDLRYESEKLLVKEIRDDVERFDIAVNKMDWSLPPVTGDVAFALMIYSRSVDVLYGIYPDMAAHCINQYMNIAYYFLKNSIGGQLYFGEVNPITTAFESILMLCEVFTMWTINDTYQYSFPRLKELVKMIRNEVDFINGEDKSSKGGKSYYWLSDGSLDYLLEIYNAWENSDYTLLPESMLSSTRNKKDNGFSYYSARFSKIFHKHNTLR